MQFKYGEVAWLLCEGSPPTSRKIQRSHPLRGYRWARRTHHSAVVGVTAQFSKETRKMRKLRLVCIWRAEQMPDSSEATSDDRQDDELVEYDEHPILHVVPELVCIHKKNRKACPICSRDWTQPQTGRLPYQPKAA
jgi:hypothetical protein